MNIDGKKGLVIGLGLSGRAAARLLVGRGATVTAVDSRPEAEVKSVAEELRSLGVSVETGRSAVDSIYDFAVMSPGLSPKTALYKSVASGDFPLISEVELGTRLMECLSVGITGTNGKSTTTELIEKMLNDCGKSTRAAGNIGVPVCDVVGESGNLDFLALELSSFQLEQVEHYRPAIAVLTNITTDHLDRYPGIPEYAKAKARIFENQRGFDWSVVQTEALAYLESLGVTIPSQTITFSANYRRADLSFDGNLIVSSLEDWEGPLLAMHQTQLRGPHNAENVMAALAVGRVLQLPLEMMIKSIKSFQASPHRCEMVGELNGVRFVNDSKGTNLDAMMKAIQSAPCANPAEPNVWLVAGGSDKGLEYHDAGPLLAERVKGAMLIGETSGRMQADWSLFTHCQKAADLEEAVRAAAEKAESGDIVLLSPACASFDQFSNYAERGNRFKEIVAALQRTTYSGAPYTSTTTARKYTLP